MLQVEITNLMMQMKEKEIGVEDFFCMVNSMLDFEDAKHTMKNVLEELKKDIKGNAWATDWRLMYDQLNVMCQNLYGVNPEPKLAANSSYRSGSIGKESGDEIYFSDDSSKDYLVTTDDFHDDGKLPENESLVAFNLSINEVQPKDDENKAKKKRKKKKKNNTDESNSPVLLWFRRDLRIFDNPALNAAAELKKPVIPVFLWNEAEEGPLAAGGATKVWLEQGLDQLSRTLQNKYDSRLILRRTEDSVKEIKQILSATGARSVVWTALYEPILKARDDRIERDLVRMGVEVKIYHSYLLHRPEQITVSGVGARGIGSVTHFMECCKSNPGDSIGKPVEPPRYLTSPSTWPPSHTLDELRLYRKPVRRDGSTVDWAKEIRESWTFGEDGGYQNLREFLDVNVGNYENESSRADMKWTSVISPYLHWGELSPRTVLHEGFVGKIATKFRRKLAWRDLSYWLLSLFPDMDREPIRPPYKKQPWNTDPIQLKAWQKGNTGFPLVDASMRQLWRVGWMNNYMRHVVASFLISYLRISWIEGYKWFQDTLLDADVAINAMMWQNGGMSGLDQWNFVMHPVDAAYTCDPKGDFVRKWVPELAKLPDKLIHQPWKCPGGVLSRAGVQLGVNYPVRIVADLEMCREQSLHDVTEVRRHHSRGFIDPQHGRDMTGIPCRLLGIQSPKVNDIIMVPLITRKEFIYRTSKPEAKDNPYNAVLKGYVSRGRDEEVARTNTVDFTASTLLEFAERKQRTDRLNGVEEKDEGEEGRGRGRRRAPPTRRTKTHDQYTKV